jgi:hypothetical protein
VEAALERVRPAAGIAAAVERAPADVEVQLVYGADPFLRQSEPAGLELRIFVERAPDSP